MKSITVTRTINAPIEKVFGTVADIRQFEQALPHVIGHEFLSEQESGVGTQFRETRVMKGRETVTELEVTEYVENDRVRMVADTNGTVWDTVFTVTTDGTTTTLVTTMQARAYKLLPKLLNPLIRGMIAKAVGKDMDLVKASCEGDRR